MSIAADLDQAIRLAGVPITGVSIGTVGDRSTWRVRPESLQAQAQSVIDTYVIPTPAQMLDQQATLTSRQKDILAMVAFAIRQSNVTAWNAMTLAEKKTAVLAGADTWKSMRVFVENNT